MRIKEATIKIKAAGTDDGLEDGQFTGYASVFGNVDSYGDVVAKGAFSGTLAEWRSSANPIPLLWGHDMADPFSNIGGLTDAKEDDRGLLVTGQIDMENPKAAQVYRLLKNGRVSQMSFAYDVLKSSPQDTPELGKHLQLDQLKLYEVSVVPIGANPQTEILAVKAAADIKAGRAISAKNEIEIRTAHEALGRIVATLDAANDDSSKAVGNGENEDEGRPAVKSSEVPQSPSASALMSAHLNILSIEGALK